MLWVKESNKKSALYVDVVKLISHSSKLTYNTLFARKKTMLQKSESVSLQKRKQGNRFFGRYEWGRAMEMYNDSLCYAENGSENISLAYANRSACFLRMKLYDECLIDIELAKEAGYPAHLMPKLDRRKDECLALMENGVPETDGPKLSFQADEQLPCMANVLKIERNENGDYSVVAKEDIDVGQTIAYEEAFSKYLYVRPGWKCNICMKRNTNLIACAKCPDAMFCYGKCQANVLHQFECGQSISDDTHLNGINMKEIRLLLQAIHMFQSADDLMNFVEEIINSDQKKLPERLNDDKSKYETYLKLKIGKPFVATEVWSAIVLRIYNFLLELPTISAMFKSKKHRRFLMHLIGQHSNVSNSNACGLNVPMNNGQSKPFYCQIGLIHRYFTYSCAPNVLNFDYDGDMMFITARPVKKGEQLFLSYFWPLIANKQQRKQTLWQQYELVCHCTLCNGTIGASLEQQQRIKDDSDYRYIIANYNEHFSSRNMNFEQALLDKCTELLKRYADLQWCKEIGEIVNAFKFTLAAKITNNNIPWNSIEYEENEDLYA